ncbi:hypothetical protein HanRHA438_Chr10g0451851 [Helianthus annuus]|uniref:Uncharacterized protein n=1 Tax=Helianthus annuus TaxID=4232 RepID=A0A251TMM7_HELAN|nr:hypothetical protein HanXRQr2_Chr10g0439741 [Helianthus annuus]KAJ0513776.1 hypothetical protein HanHA300_Chr10g0361701 [Helianthus annuus]KAJ0521689.1 hypothetical protein HanIR_Chr10g0473901 [Helianthus annuus]KAJ0529883.1 hypothetical protein HanHA89_Chr10g0383191 [Helianthus annuus]KAJ0696755.1 hypothetical protein HanLR1_Chr10g0360901 [Helianthus annuus]
MKNHHQNRLCVCVSAVFSTDPPYFGVVCRCCCSFSHDFSFYIRRNAQARRTGLGRSLGARSKKD